MRAEIWGLLRNNLKYLCLPRSQELREQLIGSAAAKFSLSRRT
jgi:hypothetical protein